MIEDPEVGTIKFYLKYWMHPELGEAFGFHELQADLCDPEKDLNDVSGSKTDNGFFPLSPQSESDIRKYGHKLKCVKEPYELFGNFNSDAASTLMVVFERCDPAVQTCKPEAEIDKWMQFKYIITLENEKKFQTHVLDIKERI